MKLAADPGFGRGRGAASETESCRVESCKQSELSALGVQSLLKGSGSFWVFNAQI